MAVRDVEMTTEELIELAGGAPFTRFISVDILSPLNNTIPVRHSRGTGSDCFRRLCPSGWPILPFLEGRGFGSFLYGSQTHSPLRAWASSLHHIHLLSAAPAAALCSRPKCVCSDSGRNPRSLCFFSSRLCRHARAHSSSHQRAGKGNALHRDSSPEAARLAPPATQEALHRRADESGVRRRRRCAPPFLAAPLLRFQCLESEEEGRKTSLYAHESAQKKTGRASARLALEQLCFLRRLEKRLDPRRSSPLS